jgi:hypothetical protein
MNRKSTPIPSPSHSCEASWISFAELSRDGRSCQSHFGRLRSNCPGNTVCIQWRIRCDWTTWG